MLLQLLAVLVGIDGEAKLLKQEFLYEKAAFPECHASTIAETPGGLVAAFFGGTYEKHRDVCIWVCQHREGKWSAPVEAANGVASAEKRYPCWNPVLYQVKDGPLLLFYKVGPSPSSWWGEMKRSSDEGQTWSAAEKLPEGMLGPVKNKPVLLPDGTLLCGSSSEHAGWRLHFETTRDWGKTWTTSGPVHDGKDVGAIQPTILEHHGGRLQALSRSRGLGKVVECWSEDGGKTWSKPSATELPNPNSGIDGLTLRDGRHLLVYNHATGGKRTPLNVALSADGKKWKQVLTLESEPGEYSYPAVIQGSDGKVHVVYTWNRKKIRYGVLEVK